LLPVTVPAAPAPNADVAAPPEPNPIENKGDSGSGGSLKTGPEKPVIAIGPGRAVLELGRGGSWIRFVPEWTRGASLISGGGFVVLVAGENGGVEEMVNTAATDPDRVRFDKKRGSLGPVQEGAAGGVRYPRSQRDDDGDGREDEDRLDGVDNDNDGKTDEDYAAAGDQMIALSWSVMDEHGKPALQFHQECYTWTHPHIDCMVAMKLTVQNAGDSELKNVCIGSLIRRPDGFLMSTQDMVPPENTGETMIAKGILLSDSDRTALAAVFFAEPAEGGLSWLTGVTSPGKNLADLAGVYLMTGKSAVAAGDSEGPAGKTEDPEPPVTVDSGERIAYGISPVLGDLAPGEQVVVYAALVAIPSLDGADRAVEDAYRTVVGDGRHRMIPPPMSVKRHSIRGTYVLEGDGQNGDPSEIVIVLANTRSQGFGADDVSYLTGIDLSRAEVTDTWRGDLEIVLTGTQVTTELHGRLKNGDLLDVTLSPAETAAPDVAPNGVSEEQYWSRPGQLDEELLSGSPNPFRDATTIYYEVPSSIADENGGVLNFANPVETSVKIYNVAGRLVSILVDTILSPGQYNEQWNAMDDNGRPVASGVYYIKLQIGQKHVTKRLIQLK
jgi:hypothetical protein